MKKIDEVVGSAEKSIGNSALMKNNDESMMPSRRFSSLASKIISELEEHFPYFEFGGERTVITWTRALAANDCSMPEHLQAAMNQVRSMKRSKPPSTGQFVAWYQESYRKALGVPSKEIVTKTLLAIYKAASDRKSDMVAQLCPVGYKVYREVDVTWLKDTNADQRAYILQIEDGYKDAVKLIDEKGINAMDEHGKPYFPPVPCFIEGHTDKKAHQEAMKPRPSNWQQTKQYKHGLEQLKAMKNLLK